MVKGGIGHLKLNPRFIRSSQSTTHGSTKNTATASHSKCCKKATLSVSVSVKKRKGWFLSSSRIVSMERSLSPSVLRAIAILYGVHLLRRGVAHVLTKRYTPCPPVDSQTNTSSADGMSTT